MPAAGLRLERFPGATPKCRPAKGRPNLFLPVISICCASQLAAGAVCPDLPAPTCPSRCSLQVFSVPPHSMFDYVWSSPPFLHLPGKREAR